ncbi:MAG: hypothetical protein M3423_01175 [Actinomycetota bacterium]|nr:hypothetical protein [Actinomycetota bacterium]
MSELGLPGGGESGVSYWLEHVFGIGFPQRRRAEFLIHSGVDNRRIVGGSL